MLTMMLIVMISLLVLGFPMMITMLAGTILAVVVYMPNVEPFIIAQQMMLGVQGFVLLSVPMFMFAADIMVAGKTANRLLDFVESFVGHIWGGLAITTAATCTLFGSISGSTQATVVAIGRPMRDKLLKRGYDDSSVMALIINSSDLAYLIPPSIGMIMYGVISGTSIGDLFIAGIIPGLLVLLFFSLYSIYYARKKQIPLLPKASWKERYQATRKSLLTFGFPVIIIGGIYSGFFSPTEAAAFSVLYAFIIEVCIFKSVKLKDLSKIAISTGIVTTVVFVLVGTGTAFAWVISYARIPQVITSTVLGTDPSVLKVLLTVNIAFFLGCMLVDPLVVIIILTPIFFPAAIAAGIDPVHLGIIITLQVAIGSATPPFGYDIFTACAIFDKPYLTVIRKTPFYILMLLFAALIITLVPGVSLFLTELL
ncbi:MAG: TRAP transporter large permease [Spirochaetia bacterium]|nr:TRAP transporter large permease [Spirochaetia bacterium]MCF7953175.1 TRAP transporter large permease [Spirochaetales bacterium]